MRFSVLKQNLEYVASKMAAIVSVKAIKPILFGALIEVEDGKIKVSATDMEPSVKMSLGESFLEGEGAFVVDAKLLEEVARNTLSDQVHFTFEENRLTYRAQNSNYDLPFMEPDDFPPIHFIEEGQSLSFPRTVLIEMIEDVLYLRHGRNDEKSVLHLVGIRGEIASLGGSGRLPPFLERARHFQY